MGISPVQIAGSVPMLQGCGGNIGVSIGSDGTLMISSPRSCPRSKWRSESLGEKRQSFSSIRTTTAITWAGILNSMRGRRSVTFRPRASRDHVRPSPEDPHQRRRSCVIPRGQRHPYGRPVLLRLVSVGRPRQWWLQQGYLETIMHIHDDLSGDVKTIPVHGRSHPKRTWLGPSP